MVSHMNSSPMKCKQCYRSTKVLLFVSQPNWSGCVSLRLCIRNIPASYSDDKLRKLVAKYAPPGAKLAEVRVMRDMKNIVDGVGVSKEYGFVSFGRHTDALGE